MQQNEYQDIEASILRFSSDFATAEGLTVVNLDASANPAEWPETNFFGPSELRVDFTDVETRVYVAMVVSTRGDANLHTMSALTNKLVNRLVPGSHVDLLNAATGDIRGKLRVVPPLRVGEVVNTDTQPARPVFVQLVSTTKPVPA